MRPIDADALEGYVRHLRKQIVEGRPHFQAEDHAFKSGEINALWTVLFLIDGAPTVELTDEAAIEHLQATGWMQNHDREMTRPGWIPFRRRGLDAEERESHPDWEFVFDCPLPDGGQEILVSNGRWVWKDEWSNDAGDCGLESGDEIEDGWAWMPMPEPPEEERT